MSAQLSTQTTKIYVLDTNVILHDASCLDRFDDNDIVIPITVLEELDRFKKGHDDINFQAREFLRRLDEVTGDLLAPEGVSLGPDKGNLRIVLGQKFDPQVASAFFSDTEDHRILNSTLILQNKFVDRNVVLVSKDTNLRMKAKALGLMSQGYAIEEMAHSDKLYTGKRTVENLPSETIDNFYTDSGWLDAETLPQVSVPIANENFILRNGSKSVLASYSIEENVFRRVEKHSIYGIKPRNAEQSFAIWALLNPKIRLVTMAGKAGTGKTLLALAAALECRREFRQILLARPVVPLSNRDIGYLPGDVKDKLDPYMQPLYDNLAVIRHQFKENDPARTRIHEMLENEKLLITPLAYIRGRSLQQMFFIVDEAQNLTPHEVKTIITRAGEGTKIVFTGDVRQIDHPYLESRSNGLTYLINRMRGQSLYAHVTLEKGERSELADLASELL